MTASPAARELRAHFSLELKRPGSALVIRGPIEQLKVEIFGPLPTSGERQASEKSIQRALGLLPQGGMAPCAMVFWRGQKIAVWDGKVRRHWLNRLAGVSCARLLPLNFLKAWMFGSRNASGQ